jgi:hypothetical protein
VLDVDEIVDDEYADIDPALKVPAAKKPLPA